MLVLLGVALGGVGFERPVAEASPHEAPAHKIARLRAKAARAQAAIDRMRARVEHLVEDGAARPGDPAPPRRGAPPGRRPGGGPGPRLAGLVRGRGRRPSGAAARAVAFAHGQLGEPYVWGASGPGSYDCSAWS